MKFEDLLINNALINPDAFRYAISLTIGMCLFVSVYLVFPLIERVTNAKQVQIMTGVHPGIFWLANLAWDITLLLVSAALAIILIVALDSNSFFTTNGAGGQVGNKIHKGLSLFLFFYRNLALYNTHVWLERNPLHVPAEFHGKNPSEWFHNFHYD